MSQAGFDDFFEERCGEGFVGGEADCAFGDFEFREFGAEFVDDEIAHGEEAAVVFEGGDGADAAVVFKGGYAVTDGFDGAFGAGREDGGADFLESGFGGFGEAGVVVGDGCFVGGVGLAFCGGGAVR